jgi:hypothetical protein
MRSHPGTSLDDPGNLIGPPWPFPEEVDEAPPDSSPDGAELNEARLDNSSAATP